MTDYKHELSFATQLARDAQSIAQRYYKTNTPIKTKADASPVTIADEAINALVIARVQAEFPECGVLGEEASWHESRPTIWVCDPIDGTIAFSMGEPTFMFSIALVHDGSPLVAVTCDLSNGDLFSATKDGGAFIGNTAIHVSSRQLDQAWLAFPTHLQCLYEAQTMYRTLAAEAYQTNIIHGGVFKGMLVAQGLADATVWPDNMHPWDIAAVKLIVEEAGGKMTDKDGNDQRVDRELRGGVILTNSITHQSILDIVQETTQSSTAIIL